MELILRWDIGVGKVKDTGIGPSPTRLVSQLMIKWPHLGDQAGRTRRFKTWIIRPIRSHGIKKDQIRSLE